MEINQRADCTPSTAVWATATHNHELTALPGYLSSLMQWRFFGLETQTCCISQKDLKFTVLLLQPPYC